MFCNKETFSQSKNSPISAQKELLTGLAKVATIHPSQTLLSFIPSVCSQVPVIVIRLPEPRGLSVETSTNNRRFLMVFPLLTAALSTPPDIWCQIVARFLISLIIELAIFVASIVQVREERWTSGMRESGSIDKKQE
ncbi:hypothetical protein ACOSP7_004627 [Xanthoceras sorbifolium]